MLDTQQHPFYQHAERQMFVAYQGGRPVARIAAIRDWMHNEYHQDKLGFFGFFESPDDQGIADQLIATATQWLRDRGCDRIRGPLNPSMKGEFGVLVKGNEYPPYLMTAWTPAYYDRLLTQSGFQVCKRFFAYLMNSVRDAEIVERNLDRMTALHDRILKRFPEVEIRTATKDNVMQLIREINVIGNTIRSQGFGFVPNTDAELDYMVSQLKRIINVKTVVVTYVEGQLAGYHVSVPNINWALKRAVGPWDWVRLPQLLFWMKRIPEVRCIAIGVDPEIRKKGLSVLLTKWMMDSYSQFRFWEFSWIAEDNVASIATMSEAVPVEQYKIFQLYEKPIEIAGV